MTIRSIPVLLLAAMVAPGLVSAEHETPGEHTHGETKTVMLDNTSVRPSALTMNRGDVLSFVNSSTHAVEITFTDPSDLEKKIRCGFVHRAGDASAPSEPWALFTWRDGKLTGNVPPGRFASVCSLAPGSYAYTASLISQNHRPDQTTGLLPAKGRIEVK